MHKHVRTIAVSAALVIGLSACGGTGGSPAPSTAAAPASAPDLASPPAPVPAPSSAAPSKPTTLSFGKTMEYEDGIALTVTHRGAGQATESAAGADQTGGMIQLFDIAVVNGSQDMFDPATIYPEVNYGAAGTPAEQVFDSAQGLAQTFQGTIMPGGQQTVTVAFAIPTDAPQDVVMTIRPSFEHKESVYFAAGLK